MQDSSGSYQEAKSYKGKMASFLPVSVGLCRTRGTKHSQWSYLPKDKGWGCLWGYQVSLTPDSRTLWPSQVILFSVTPATRSLLWSLLPPQSGCEWNTVPSSLFLVPLEEKSTSLFVFPHREAGRGGIVYNKPWIVHLWSQKTDCKWEGTRVPGEEFRQ